MPSKKQLTIIVAFLVVLLTVMGVVSSWVSAYSPDYYHQIQKNIDVFGRVYQEVAKKYVEEVDPSEFMRAGIDGMLSTLDPYTVLVEKEDNDELQIMSSGKYGGLGMRIGMRSNWPTVVEPPFDGTPAHRAGIREGDQIIEVAGESTKGSTISEVASHLRGEIGTEVFLRIIREGEEMPIEFRLIRAEIVVTDVVYADIIQDKIGYIRLRHFSRNAGKDIQKAIRNMKKEGMNSLILDLRSNPGGLLEAAISVSENFIEKGTLVVSTEGRTNGSMQKFYSEKDPVLEELPLVILVDGLSASASEIVAGAVQDLDRGVIIGRDTWGKGLVQTVVPISDDAALKITTAKYLIPSGRYIQDLSKFMNTENRRIVHPGDVAEPGLNGDGASPEEGAKEDPGELFKTASGRDVYASHGIEPDIEIEQPPLTDFELELLRKTMPFQFAVSYAARHPDLEPGFEVTEEILTEFRTFVEEHDFTYESKAELALNEIEKIATERQYLASAETTIEQLRQVIYDQKRREFDNSREFVRQELKQEISAKLWGTRAEIEASFDSDEVIKRAISTLSDPARYDSILNLNGEKGGSGE